MKNIAVLLEILFLSYTLPLHSQSGFISFSGINTDNGQTLSLDSIYISNLANDIDTMIYDGSNFGFGFFTGIDNKQLYNPELTVSQCYPSVCEEFTRLDITTLEYKELKLFVYSMSGQAQASFSQFMDGGVYSFQINTNGLSQGIYAIRVLSGGKEQTVKFIKSGSKTGMDCQILYSRQGGYDSKPMQKGLSGLEGLFRFIAYAKECVNDTLDNVSPENGKNYLFKLTKGRETGGDACNSLSVWYDWKCYPAEYLKDWGIGENESEYYHNDKDYSWYIDQRYTGQHSGNNCGPASVTMAARWSDPDFEMTCEHARETYRSGGGWWYTNNIIDYLNLYSIPNYTVVFSDFAQIEQIIKDGSIIILCISTAYLRRTNRDEDRRDRFYDYASGHFVVVKGVRTVDQTSYCETFDPYSWGRKYYDQSEKGKNRHYRAADIKDAISKWWKYLIVVSPKGQAPMKSYHPEAVNPNTIIHQYGR